MTIEDFTSAVRSRAEGRYDVQTASAEIDEWLFRSPESLSQRQVIRLRRLVTTESRWRTLLVTRVQRPQDVSMAIRWSAEVRDTLTEPGTSDLYLFLLGEDIHRNIGADIEANDLFCRKFVLREGETAEMLLDRTFLSRPFSQRDGLEFNDPLHHAMSQTALHHPWFSSEIQEMWRQALLSGKQGNEIADFLLFNISEGKDLG